MADQSQIDTAEFVQPVDPSGTRPPHPLSAAVRVDIAARSDPGKVRPGNEDHFLAARLDRTAVTLLSNLPAGQVPRHFRETSYALVVADGMGGSAAGEVASSLAIAVGINLGLHHPKWGFKITDEEAQDLMERVRDRIRKIDLVVWERAHGDPALAGMGTTLTAAYSVGGDLFLFHVGDSRAYLHRGGRLRRLTHDHTVAQELADAGLIDPTEVQRHRLRHVLTRAVGGHQGEVRAEIQHLRLTDGDHVLLCTDGLTDMVTEEQIAPVLQAAGSADDACGTLVQMALDAGGRDNVTVVLARYTIPAEPQASSETR